ncbi:MAG: mechanosensitive ion channel domain-containing protein, partial [Parvularculaceae bacterium]
IDATGAVEPAKDGAPKTPHGLWSLMRGAGRAVAGLTVLAPFAGYIDLADFVTSRIYYLSLVLAIAWFARALARQAAGWTAARLRGAQEGQTKEEASTFDLFWVNAAIDAVFALALIPALLILAGYHFAFVRDFISQAFFGFQIGGVQVPSLARILTAIAVFVGILALTRLVQRGLQRGPFAHSRVDPGVQNSLSTLAGYAGLIIASLLGVTALGFNLANLALIAGALSVGIGFGLQSTVNNFVSGLILLFERPIKVGDWVVTASGEGTVKRISVRSTEIETFDRASIIVPNSEMVSQTVTNWTHKNKIGRIAVRVGVSYAADPEQVREVLLKCARDHPLVVRYPEPFVVWKDFGASSLEFEIRCFLRDIGEGLGVRSDLRFAIFKAFKAAGIDMPFPQQDVYIKSTADGEIEKKPTPKKSTPDAAAPAPPLNEPEIAGDD